MLVNARSLTNNTIDNLINILLKDEDIDVCCVTETWLKPGDQAILADINLRGYEIVSSPREDKRGGGIAFLCKSSCKYKEVKTHRYIFFELLEVIFNCKNNNNIRFSTIYRTGYLNIQQREHFLNELSDYLESLISKDGVNVVWGDFNISKDQLANKSFYADFIDLMESKGFNLVIDKPTHIKNGILDLIFLPSDLTVGPITIFGPDTCADISDHFPIKMELPLVPEKDEIYIDIECRNFNDIDLDIFKKNISSNLNTNLINNIATDGELENVTEFFINTLSVEVDSQAPKIKKRIKKTKHVVSNPQIAEARRVKRRAERKFKKTKSEKDREVFKEAKKKLNSIITQSRNKFFNDKFGLHKNDIRSTYKIINQLLNKTNKTIFPDHNDESLLANKFAFFYREKIEKIRNNFMGNSNCSSSPFQTQYKRVYNPLAVLQPVTSDEVLSIINGLVNKQSILDIIPCCLLKKLAHELVPTLVNIINASFRLGKFPSQLKEGTVTPVLKATNLENNLLNNYRPVTNLPLFSKVVEKCGLERLVSHLELNNLYPKYQSAYRANHSCETALMKVVDDVLAELNPDTYVMLTFLDFSAAFDTVDHKLLIHKLKDNFGITDNALSWFKSYLTGRSYKIKINGTLSNSQSLKFGVPQGSILGPILYTLYVKEIEEIAQNHHVKVHVYADDVLLYVPCTSSSNINITRLQDCLQVVQQWANVNFLKLNKKKTQLLCISSKKYSHSKPSHLDIMGEMIKVDSSAKYLGFWLDEHLDFSKQINNVCSQGYWALRNLWKISSKVIDIEIRTQLVHSCILSKLNFCNGLYISLQKKEIFKLDKLLKAGVRFIYRITGTDRRQRMTPYLQQLHFLPISYRLDFKICLMVYKCFQDQAPLYLKELLLPRINYYFIGTRLDTDLTWLNPHSIEKIVYKTRSFRHAAPDKWNKLSQLVRTSPSIDNFKTRLKTFYFEEWVKKSSSG